MYFGRNDKRTETFNKTKAIIYKIRKMLTQAVAIPK